MIEFRDVEHGSIHGLNASAPDGAFIGIIGLEGSGQDALLRLAAGLERPEHGEVRAPADRRMIVFGEQVDGSPPALLAVNFGSSQDAVAKAQASVALERMRRNGSTILMASHDESLL